MIILGIDPGPKKSAFATIAVERNSKPIILRWGMVKDPVEVMQHVASFPSFVVALETVEGFAWSPERSASLIDTSFVAGKFYGLLTGCGFRVDTLSARRWRKVVTGSASASDKAIKRTLGLLLGNLPKMNVHCRDAIGVALGLSKLERVRKLVTPTTLG